MKKYESVCSGQKYGKLTVIKSLGKITSFSKWLCLCDCGNSTTASTHHLYTGVRKSCGCARLTANPQETLVKNMYSDYKYNAKKKEESSS